MANGTFGTAINCMDGRAQIPVIEWMKENCALDYVDSITVPGADKVMVGSGDEVLNIRKRADLSVNVHGSRVVAICGHHDCAGNPVSENEHRAQIVEAVNMIDEWDLPVEVIGLWIGEDWAVERII